MPIKPKFTSGSNKTDLEVNRKFTDREDLIQLFNEDVKTNNRDEHNIVMYYGVGGIGKTSLRKELTRLINNTKENIIASLDFDLPAFRQEETALYYLRKTLKETYKIQFPSFEIAYTVYWQKTHPQTAISKESLPLADEGGIVASVVSTLGNVPLIGLIPGIAATVIKSHKFFKDWWTKRGEKELLDLPQLEAKDILERLPMFFAGDLNDYLNENNKSCVIFIDTYEALWEQSKAEGGFFLKDEWIRELVAQLPSPLWVILGREKLRWSEIEADWNNYIKQNLVGGLSKPDSIRFLQGCNISDSDILEHISVSSRGVPYFLDIAVDTYCQIIQRFSRKPVVNDFADKQVEVLDRFLRYLDKTEIETLKLLSVPRYWDNILFSLLMSEFKTGYPVTAMNELCRFSFVRQDNEDKTFTLQGLMKEGLLSRIDGNLKESVNKILFEFYQNQLKDIKVADITLQHEKAFIEAFYHGNTLAEPDKFTIWFFEIFNIFYEAGKWKILIGMCEELIVKIKNQNSENTLYYPKAVNALGRLYESAGKYNEAKENYKKAVDVFYYSYGDKMPEYVAYLNDLGLINRIIGYYEDSINIFEKAIEIQNQVNRTDLPGYAKTLNNLATTYYETGNYVKAGEILGEAIKIIEKTLGVNHPDYANSINNLANVFCDLKLYDRSIELHEKASRIFKETLGENNPKFAVSIMNLANVLGKSGRFYKAAELIEKVIENRKITLGEEHPVFANSLNSLANVYVKLGKFNIALELFERSAKIRRNTLGENHPEYAQSLNNLGSIYSIMGQYDEAIILFEKAMEIRAKITGENSYEYACLAENIANVYIKTEMFEKAISFYKKSLSIYENEAGKNPEKIQEILFLIKDLYSQTGKNVDEIDQKLQNLIK